MALSDAQKEHLKKHFGELTGDVELIVFTQETECLFCKEAREIVLELGALSPKIKTKVNDFKQIIDSVAIDVDYNSKLFNAEVIDLPDKKEIIKAKYSWEYQKKGKYTVAIKIVDVLGEEYFETFEVNA